MSRGQNIPVNAAELTKKFFGDVEDLLRTPGADLEDANIFNMDEVSNSILLTIFLTVNLDLGL